MRNTTVVIDYGIGNLLSVCRALEYCGSEYQIAEKGDEVEGASRIILPGVGAFSDGMNGLKDRGFIPYLRTHAEENKPLLGICLGMQMLLERSYEFGEWQGLGIIEGEVRPVPRQAAGGVIHKIPHIGWNELLETNTGEWEASLLKDTPKGSAFYFVHSFMAVTLNSENCLAYCDYGGVEICAVVRKGNVYGVQFHPEKSGKMGLHLIQRFLEL